MKTSFNKITGVSLIAASLLFLTRSVFLYIAGTPPTKVAEIASWLGHEKFAIAMTNELLFFATLALIPAVYGLYRLLAPKALTYTVIGCGLLGVVISVLSVLCIVHGRLVYPIYGLPISPESQSLVISIFYGGIHTVLLMMAVVNVCVSRGLAKAGFPKTLVYFGYLVALANIAGAYPWLLGQYADIICQIMFAVWFMVLGSTVYARQLAK